jgi:inositol transport system substrate-binding protein
MPHSITWRKETFHVSPTITRDRSRRSRDRFNDRRLRGQRPCPSRTGCDASTCCPGCCDASTAAPTAASAAAAPAAAIPVLGDLKVDKKIKIGVTMKFDDLWLTTMRDAMNEYAKSLGSNVEMVFVDSKDDSATQLSQVENFVTQKLDAIVIVPADTDATDPMSQAVLAAKIPLVYVNRKPSNLPASAAFVASQSIDAGIFQME